MSARWNTARWNSAVWSIGFTREAREYLKTIFKNQTCLSGVKTWLNAQPRTFPSSPFGWVRPLGGQVEAGTVGARKTFDSFEVVVVVKSGNPESAENEALNLKEAVEEAVNNDPLLSGLVSSAYVSNRESYQLNDVNDSFSAWKVTVTTWRFS